MKKIQMFLITFISIIFAKKVVKESPILLESYEQNKQKIFNLIREHAKKYSKGFPKTHEKLIRNIQGITEFKMTQIPISQLHLDLLKENKIMKYSLLILEEIQMVN